MTDHDRELDEQAARLARPLRQSERLPDDFEARLVARVRAEARAAGTGAPVELRAARPLYAPPPAWRRATRWAFEARPVAVSPARVALLAAGLVAAAVLGGRLLERGTGAERRELVADTGAP